jgi:hypothetical protein
VSNHAHTHVHGTEGTGTSDHEHTNVHGTEGTGASDFQTSVIEGEDNVSRVVGGELPPRRVNPQQPSLSLHEYLSWTPRESGGQPADPLQPVDQQTPFAFEDGTVLRFEGRDIARHCVANETFGEGEFDELDAAVMGEGRIAASAAHSEGSSRVLLTGAIGEALVYHAILHGKLSLGLEGEGWTAEWVNEHGESLLPYDIKVTSQARHVFIEVKTTTVPNKNHFEISLAELDCAREHADNYMLARVYLSPSLDKASHRVNVSKSIHELIETSGIGLLLRF